MFRLTAEEYEVLRCQLGTSKLGSGGRRYLPYVFSEHGVVMAANGTNPPHQESVELIQRDFEGHVLWRFDHNQQIPGLEGTMIWSLRQPSTVSN